MTRPIPQTDTPKPSGGLQTIRRVLPYLWPEGQGWVKRRVVLSLVMLVVAKFVSVSTPVLYKQAVDALAAKIMKGGSGVWGAIPMPANPQVNDADAKKLAAWVLSNK